MALEITDATFNDVLNSEKPVLIDIWAEWCGPCRMITPIIDNISNTMSDKIVVGKINADTNPETLKTLGVRNIPTILIFKNKELVHKHVGVITQEKLEEIINSL